MGKSDIRRLRAGEQYTLLIGGSDGEGAGSAARAIEEICNALRRQIFTAGRNRQIIINLAGNEQGGTVP